MIDYTEKWNLFLTIWVIHMKIKSSTIYRLWEVISSNMKSDISVYDMNDACQYDKKHVICFFDQQNSLININNGKKRTYSYKTDCFRVFLQRKCNNHTAPIRNFLDR